MSYLERQQNEKFNSWAGRVYKRCLEIKEESRHIWEEYDVTPYNKKTGKHKVGLLKPSILENHRALVCILANQKYPRSIASVNWYIDTIRFYEFSLNDFPKFPACMVCDKSDYVNFFSEICEFCTWVPDIPYKTCKTCMNPISYGRHSPWSNITKLVIAFTGRMRVPLYLGIHYRIAYQDYCIRCIKNDYSARLIQYVWKAHKKRDQNWKDEITANFVDKIVKYNCNKRSLYDAFMQSKDFNYKAFIKMRGIEKYYDKYYA
jgi:hypothetical protein